MQTEFKAGDRVICLAKHPNPDFPLKPGETAITREVWGEVEGDWGNPASVLLPNSNFFWLPRYDGVTFLGKCFIQYVDEIEKII